MSQLSAGGPRKQESNDRAEEAGLWNKNQSLPNKSPITEPERPNTTSGSIDADATTVIRHIAQNGSKKSA
jgi:hypothetical protein